MDKWLLGLINGWVFQLRCRKNKKVAIVKDLGKVSLYFGLVEKELN